jgi:hypothetical protein
MSEFKYGDMVEVRDYENQDWATWKPRFYLGAIPLPDGKVRHFTMCLGQDESSFNGHLFTWNYVRKFEPVPTIEERLEQLEARFNTLINKLESL